MKNFSILLILFLATKFSFAQFEINSPFFRSKDFEIYQDSSEHTNIQPFFNAKKCDTIDKYFQLSPLFVISQNYDLSTKNFSYNYAGGLSLSAKFTKNLDINILGFGGIAKPPQFIATQVDTTEIIPQTAVAKNNGKYFSYFNFAGNISYTPADYIYFQTGKGKAFLGDGYRSLLLSDNALPYPYFRTVVHTWKVKYFYQIAFLKDKDNRFDADRYYSKYTYTQYLSFNLWKRLNFSMFETVVQSAYDSLGAKRNIDVNYLNPVIFLRSVEYNIGSPDNVLVGFSGHLKIFKSAMLYGQIFIDEFQITHILSKDEYWDEKYGLQAGFKNYNTLNIKNFYTQFEFNAVRPYTYSHGNTSEAYTFLQEPLAHPFGANFAEVVAITGYNYKNFFVNAKFVYAQSGQNDSLNYGSNPAVSYDSRLGDENIQWLQGDKTSFQFAKLSLSYVKIVPVTLSFIYRNKQNSTVSDKNLFVELKISTPMFEPQYDRF